MTRLLTLLLLLALLVPTSVIAQPAPSLTLAIETGTGQSSLGVMLEPGETLREDVRLTATAATAATLAIANVTSPPNGGIVVVGDAAPAAPAIWLAMDTGTLNLDPASPLTRELAIVVPDDAAPGQYVAALVLETTTSQPLAGGSLGQRQRATMLVSVTVPGETTASFETGDPGFDISAAGPVLMVPIANEGDVAIAPAGEVTIETANGQPVVSVPVTLGIILPGVETFLQWPIGVDLSPGDYLVSLELDDAATGARARVADQPVTLAPEEDAASSEPLAAGDSGEAASTPTVYAPDGDPVTVTIRDATLTAQGSPVDHVLVSANIVNAGEPIDGATLLLDVFRDGQPVETVTMLEFASVPAVTMSVGTTYAPEDGFTAGLWTFRLRLAATGGDGTVLAQTGTIGKLDLP